MVFGCWSYRLRWLQAPIDWGQSIYHTPAAVSSMVELLSPIALPGAPAAASYGFRLLVLPVAVASGADRLGTIDLPYARGGCFEPSDSFSAFLTLRSAGGFTRTLALARPLAESLLRSLGPAPRTLPILRANTTAGAPWAPLLVMH